MRGENESLFTGATFSANIVWRTVLEDMGLQGSVTPLQAKKKWDNLKKRYKDCKYPGSGEGVEDTPRPSSAVGDQEDEDQVEAGPSRPKRKDGLMDLIREDMKLQREAEEKKLADK
ncbi:hypothetical protein JOQ06_005788 [Pogonophryne albipinna]|uniref:Myb/SANT-like DNA-binding domain-containing protein n=1 Tax=Pogonophryne albipinna TaxID=1090488 RepID=A0AAD6FS11_9TELE|nr:hypothetical protein JOQ06_005788 [Pogonophryne albipinna]